MASADTLTVRRAGPADVPELHRLFAEAFGRTLVPGYFEWRFFANALGRNWAFVAQEDGRIVGFASLTPQPVWHDGERRIIGTSGTSMVHPSMQRRGVYGRLADVLYATAQAEGCDFICGFPNQNSHYGRIAKLDWFDLHEVPQVSRAVARDDAAADSAGFAALPAEAMEESEVERWAEARRRSCPGISLREDAPFFAWRYARHPSNRYTVFRRTDGATGLVFKSYAAAGARQADILTLNAVDPEGLEELIHAFLGHCARAELTQVNLWWNFRSHCYRVLEKLGFAHTAPITWFSGMKREAPLDRFNDFANWEICFALSDVY